MPSRPMPPVVYGESSGTTALPSRALTIGAASVSATCSSSSPAPSAPWPARMTVFFPPLSSGRGALERLGLRDDDRRRPGLGRVPLDVHRPRGRSSEDDFSCQSLQQLMCATPRAASAARQAASTRACGVRRAHDLLVEDGHVREELQQVDLLLVVHADQVVIGLPGDRQHRGAVHLGVVEAVQQVDRARGPRWRCRRRAAR